MNIHEIIIRLLIEQPYYGYVASSVSFVESEKVEGTKMAILPSMTILYNPVWFKELSDNHKIGVVLHELLHVILLHQYRRNNREIMLWSIACDMAVNEMIDKKYLNGNCVTVNTISKHLRRKIEKNRNAEYYYKIITDVSDSLNFIIKEDSIILVFEEDSNFKINKLSEESVSEVEIKTVKNKIIDCIQEAKSEGELPSDLEDRVQDIFEEYAINWRNIVKRFLSGKGKMITRKSYKTQSRRFDDLPGTKRSIGAKALLAIDESGSISDSLVKVFYKELIKINKITGVSFMVTRFDTKCSTPQPLNRFIINNKREKRGGTDFRPVFELADNMKIPLVIVFTDGKGEVPNSVNQKTLWVLTDNAKRPANYGYYVNFEE